MKSESSLTLHRLKGTITVKAQEHSKDFNELMTEFSFLGELCKMYKGSDWG